MQGWSTNEIAKYLDCAPKTVSVHVHRGVHRLRARLGGVALAIFLLVVCGAVVRGLVAIWTKTPAVNVGPTPPGSGAPAGLGLPFEYVVVAVVMVAVGAGIVVVAELVRGWWSRRQ